jgi:uncharacterized membrane protein YdjX (TVP38/TMEM64 family)
MRKLIDFKNIWQKIRIYFSNDRKKILKDILYVLGIGVFVIFFFWFLSVSDSEMVQGMVEKAGIWGPIVFVIFFIISQVFAPVSGTPALLLSYTLYGLPITIIMSYIASLISATINFYISRLYGRRLVKRLAGERMMKEIDDFVEVSGSKMLILSRTLGFFFFEIISYAAGLTSISFKLFITITATFSLIPALIIAIAFRFIDNFSENGEIVWLSFMVLCALLFAYLFRRIVVKTKKELREGDK